MKNYSQYSDSQLFELFSQEQRNKADIFTEIYNRTSVSIYNYCFHILANPQDANDATQETFVKFYQQKEFHHTFYLKGYLFKVARNECLRILRKSIELEPINEEDFGSLELNLETKELSQIINHAIERLPFSLREVFILKFVQGMDYEEIAKITMLNISTIRTKVYRAITKMQEMLKPHYIENLKEQNK